MLNMVYVGILSFVRNIFLRFGVEFIFVDGIDFEKYREVVKLSIKVSIGIFYFL